MHALQAAEGIYHSPPSPEPRPLASNGFEVSLPGQLDVIVRALPDPSEVKAERARLKGYWFVHWFDGKLFHLRLKAGGPNVDGNHEVLETAAHPWLFRARLDDALEDALPNYSAVRQRPFTFLAQKAELIDAAASAAGIFHKLLPSFKVTPRFTLNPKIYEPSDGETKVGIFVTIGMRYDIEAMLTELQDAGIDLRGMYAVRRIRQYGERGLLGRIRSVENGQVTLFEESDDPSFDVAEVKLEGSKENFSRCLNTLLGYHYKKLLNALDDEEAGYRTGPKFDQAVEKMGEFLARKPIKLGDGIEATVGDRIMFANEGQTRNIRLAPTVEYVFDRTGVKSAEYAWLGLSQYGPFDRSGFANRSPRILVAYPSSTQGKVENFLRSFRDGMGTNYPQFAKGFVDLMGLTKVEFVMCPVEVSAGDRNDAFSRYNAAIEEKLAGAGEVHAGIVVLLDEHARLPDDKNPYIHTKSLLLTLGIPTQEVRMPTVLLEPKSLQYTLQNFSVSMYAKLNGTPWTVNHDKAINDELVVGMGLAELSGSRTEKRQRFVGITTVFAGDGSYLLGNVSKECAYEGYPEVIRESMLGILRELKKRNNWRPCDTVRVVFHAHRPLKRVDVANIVFDCTREIGSEQDIQMAFVTISHEHPFVFLDRAERGVPLFKGSDIRKGAFAPARGSIARVGRLTRLLAVNAPRLIKRANAPLPTPLLVSLHPDSTFKDVDYLAEQALKFTSLSWRSTLPAATPVTVFYSERIAELLGRLKNTPNWSSANLNVKLKWSRWFL
ncbi:argonaute/piwi family protein [Mesorhizobium mediterraneum]|uniref:argonaute/piwi family protein n=1 Tax=Mesorhizobium mediterraneum TaxID=43617 RepID=UPI00177FA3BE|nr:Piwi domain-containing protein [Mesorhizobium mediterraneum]